MKKLISAAALSALLSFTASAADIEAGKAKSLVCSACHGPTGVAVIPTYPNLKGQHEEYIKLALHAYKKKERTGGQAVIMQAQASLLSDTDIENLAAYYSSLK